MTDAKERLMVAEDEYRRLCYEIKKKEVNRNSKQTKVQQLIKNQWDTISELKKKKNELCLLLRLQESHSFSGRSSQNAMQFKKSLNEVIRLEENIKQQTRSLQKYNQDILSVDKQVRARQKSLVEAQRRKGRLLKHQRDISFLENRLNGSLNKYNQLVTSNRSAREEILSLLLTQSAFRRKYEIVRRLIASASKALNETVHSATLAYQTGESVKYKVNLIKERTQVDQKKLGEKVKDLRILVEQDQQLKEFLAYKRNDRSPSGFGSETQGEEILEQRLLACRSAMARIQLSSGCQEVASICKAFVQQEEESASLLEAVNSASLQAEQMQEEVRICRKNLQEQSKVHQEQEERDTATRSSIETTTDELRNEAQKLEDMSDTKSKELECVKVVVGKIFEHLSPNKISLSVDDGITDDNILQYLEVLEERIGDILQCYHFVKNEVKISADA